MKFLRPLFFSILGLALLAGVGAWLVSRPSVQTWAVRRAFPGRADLKVEIGSVSAGWNAVELAQVKIEQPGVLLLVPSMRFEIPLVEAAKKHFSIGHLVAKGWTLDFTVPRPETKSSAERSVTSKKLRLFLAAIGSAALAQTRVDDARPSNSSPALFDGILRLFDLPFDLSVETADLDGLIVFPGLSGHPPARANVALDGGPLAFGREGRFNLHAQVRLFGKSNNTVELSSTATGFVEMASARTFREIRIDSSTTAAGLFFAESETLQFTLDVARAGRDENYRLELNAASLDKQKKMAELHGRYEKASGALSGNWACDAREADLAALFPERSLPSLSAQGAGNFEVNQMLDEIHAVGRLETTFENLGSLRAELSSVGRLRFLADFDVLQHGDGFRVQKLKTEISGVRPIATVRALQGFEFNLRTGELKVADPASDLVHLTLEGVPVSWAQPFLNNVSMGGNDVRGEFVAGARRGGFELRPLGPMSLAHFALSQNGEKLLHAVDLSLWVTADYSPEGWQIDVTEFKLQSQGATLFSLAGKLGQPAGAAQPVKAKGDFHAELAALGAQPFAASFIALTRGTARGSFSANLSPETRGIEAKLDFDDLATAKETLPSIAARLRADLHANGELDANIPIVLARAGHKSDVELSVHAVPDGAEYAAEAQLTSKVFFAEDAEILLAPLARPKTASGDTLAKASTREKNFPQRPFWDGGRGQLKLAIEELICERDLKVTRVNGLVKVEPLLVTLDNLRASLSEGSEVKLTGAVNFANKSKTPYEFSGNLSLNGFDPAPLLIALDPGQLPTVEGHFDLVGKIYGSTASPMDWTDQASADLKLNCRGGKFRGFNTTAETNLGKIQQGLSSRIASLLSMGASMIGHSSAASSAEKARAASSALRHFSNLDFDQLNVELSCRPKIAPAITDFSLISPEIRVNGEGTLGASVKGGWLASPLALDLQIGVRGPNADDLKLLGLLRPEPDALGYFVLADRLHVQGTAAEMSGNALIQLIQQKLAAP